MPVNFYDLPVYRNKEEILKALDTHQVIVIESPTGSGKTTQLPLILREAGYADRGIIGITQPRRIATLSICDFIKRQINDDSSYCAYTMRFADTSTALTRIKIMTDGILLQEVKDDPMLSRYSVIMVDEAHERSLNIDFILGLLKEIIQKRSDLKVVISSATINTKVFSDFFFNAPIVSIDAKTYPVDIRYRNMFLSRDTEDIYYENIEKIIAEDKRTNPGDVLVFLPGEADIRGVVRELETCKNRKKYQVYPLFGRLSKEDQEKVFTPTEKGKTKVVVATNIAETSITIDGVTTVIDSGLAKVNFYNQENFTSTLKTMGISQSSADQRKGRAGRTREGVCYRLYPEDQFKRRPKFSEEEILHSDLAEVVLRMSEIGIYNYDSFPFVTPPGKKVLGSAVETLLMLGAINPDHTLTNIGRMMIKFPLLPRLSRTIVESIMNYPGVLDEVITAVAFLSTRSPYVLPMDEEYEAREAHKSFQNAKYGDFIAMRTLYGAYTSLQTREEKEDFAKSYYLDIQTLDEIVNIHEQLCELVSADGIPITSGGSVDDYFCCLISGLRQYVGRKEDRYAYRTIEAGDIYIHPGSAWFRTLPTYIIAGEIVQTTKRYARTVSPVYGKWLDSIDPKIQQALCGCTGKPGKEKKGKKEKGQKDQYQKLTKAQRKAEAEKRIEEELGKLETVKNGKKVSYIASLDEILGLTVRSNKVKIFIRNGKYLSRVPVKSARIDREVKLIRNVPVITARTMRGKYSPYDSLDKIFEMADECFTPVKGSRDRFDYLALTENDGLFSLVPYPTIEDAADETLTSLYILSENIPKKNKKDQRRVYPYIHRIEDALGL